MKPPEPVHAPKAIQRTDYRAPDFLVETVDLDVRIFDAFTEVRAALAVARAPGAPTGAPLVLDGEKLELVSVAVDGRALAPGEYEVGPERLVVPGLPAACRLETVVRIDPKANTALMGLYVSRGMYCTQCEATGFRRITYFPDRPDVMARYTTRIEADRARFPVLLSNGNRVAAGEAEGGRHWVRWEDPWKKPCYLFALVAGDLGCHAGTFTTLSGREVRLEVWCEPADVEKCGHALRSLQASMAWDEAVYGREYDLDLYMIVAASDFNFGAMENKGLNIFNAKYVLASPATATDDDYEAIEGIVGHEYFHNWTGNRVTCRDWFQLTLKEGLTVFRDQEFTADRTSRPVKRIADVRRLRLGQFPEDAGPMRHPIRPEAYVSMENFYTSTVYQKGAEVIRMLHTLVGPEAYRRGTDLYFERHDGQAVTCDDFVRAIADAAGWDDGRRVKFMRWYFQAGTPTVEAEGRWDAAAGTFALTLRQALPEGAPGPGDPLTIPVATGLLGPDGADLPLRLEGEREPAAGPTRVLALTERAQTFRFVGLPGDLGRAPVPSLLRGFSAPVRLRCARAREELAFLLAHDHDAFNRWDAGQELAQQVLLELAAAHAAGTPATAARVDPALVAAFGRVLDDARLDGSIKSLMLTLPAELQLAQEVEPVDPDALHAAREAVRRALAEGLAPRLRAAYDAHALADPAAIDAAAIAARRLRATALAYLAVLDGPDAKALATAQLEGAATMTDAQAALTIICDRGWAEREAALAAFHARWKDDPIVLDKWFQVQAGSSAPDTVERVRALRAHPDFGLGNPNRVRALIGVFALGNQVRFHAPDGRGYDLVADAICELDGINPQVAARMTGAFNHWKRFEPGRRALQRARLERIAAKPGLSKDVREIVDKALG